MVRSEDHAAFVHLDDQRKPFGLADAAEDGLHALEDLLCVFRLFRGELLLRLVIGLLELSELLLIRGVPLAKDRFAQHVLLCFELLAHLLQLFLSLVELLLVAIEERFQATLSAPPFFSLIHRALKIDDADLHLLCLDLVNGRREKAEEAEAKEGYGEAAVEGHP